MGNRPGRDAADERWEPDRSRPGTDRSALVERLGVAAERAPRLRQRPDALPGRRTRPAWVDDEAFDAEDHIRTAAVASPGGQRQVLDLVALIEPAPFDANMSPWDLTIIEGLAGGRAALYLRAHHSLTDGMRAVSLVGLFLDETATPAAGNGSREPVVSGEESAPDEAAGNGGAAGPSSEPSLRRKPGTVSVTIDLAGAVRPLAHGVTAALRIDPIDAVVRGVQRGLDVANSVSRQVVVTGGRLSPLSSSRSASSRFETMSVTGARETALRLGGSRNDLLVAGAALGVGRYHARLGMPCPRTSSGVSRPLAPRRGRRLGRANSGGDSGRQSTSRAAVRSRCRAIGEISS